MGQWEGERKEESEISARKEDRRMKQGEKDGGI